MASVLALSSVPTTLLKKLETATDGSTTRVVATDLASLMCEARWCYVVLIEFGLQQHDWTNVYRGQLGSIYGQKTIMECAPSRRYLTNVTLLGILLRNVRRRITMLNPQRAVQMHWKSRWLGNNLLLAGSGWLSDAQTKRDSFRHSLSV